MNDTSGQFPVLKCAVRHLRKRLANLVIGLLDSVRKLSGNSRAEPIPSGRESPKLQSCASFGVVCESRMVLERAVSKGKRLSFKENSFPCRAWRTVNNSAQAIVPQTKMGKIQVDGSHSRQITSGITVAIQSCPESAVLPPSLFGSIEKVNPEVVMTASG